MVAGDFTNSLVVVMSACCLSAGVAGSVRVISIHHDSLLFLEVPSDAHPAATAAPKTVVLTEHIDVSLVLSKCAIDELLLGEAAREGASLLGNGTFESCVSCESPAGTAATLVFDGVHESIGVMINCDGSVAKMTTFAFTVMSKWE
jgi:hypothetical protein